MQYLQYMSESGPETILQIEPFMPLEDLQEDLALRELIMKVHSRCDLSCDNCYMYELADKTTWREQPRMGMSMVVVEATGDRLGEHATRHKPRNVDVIFHGGEALLKPPEFFDQATRAIRNRVPLHTVVNFSLQTNGTRLNEEYLEVFRERRIRVGLSLDGNQEANDRHRVYANGNSSYDKVMRAVALLNKPRYKHLLSGVLAVVDLENDPLDTYHALRETGAPDIDFLLPLGNWENRPISKLEDVLTSDYAEWLTPIFTEWLHEGRLVPIRSFNSIINLILGKKSLIEGWGPDKEVSEIVVQSDGSFELVDTLRSAYVGATKTGLHVAKDGIDQALKVQKKITQEKGGIDLSEICQGCAYKNICAGGYLPHRYRPENGYDNPSVYCADNSKLIQVVRSGIAEYVQRGHHKIGQLLLDRVAALDSTPSKVQRSYQNKGALFGVDG